MRRKTGFTLIELMIAIMIFAIISLISYRVISALLITKQVVTNSQNKWGSLARANNRISGAIRGAIPLVIRDDNSAIMPAVMGKSKLEQKFDAQLEMTVSGRIGDAVYGTYPPKRIGFRFIGGTLYLVSWPVLNRVITTTPRVDILLSGVSEFTVNFLYPDMKWRDSWPLNGMRPNVLPSGIKINIVMKSGETILRQWSL